MAEMGGTTNDEETRAELGSILTDCKADNEIGPWK